MPAVAGRAPGHAVAPCKDWPARATNSVDAVAAAAPASFLCRDQEIVMPKFIIERNMPGAGQLTGADLKAGSAKSAAVLSELGPSVQWIQSYVTDDKLYCVYIAPDEGLVRRHAELSGFPADSIARVRSVIDPTTAE
jgi:hypothetical protein